MAQQFNWFFEPSHCKIGFSVRHFGISETEGFFHKFSGTIANEREDFTDAVIDFNVEVDSIDTHDAQRDAHLKSPDFIDVTKYPLINFKSTSLTVERPGFYKLSGLLAMNGVAKEVAFDVEFGGIIPKDPFGNTKAGFLLEGSINRKDWGITWNRALDFGGVAVGETVKIKCHIELQKN